MNLSFYSAASSVAANQLKLDVIANNIANINTHGFKTQSAMFHELLYTNMNSAEVETPNLTYGNGSRIEKTDISFAKGTIAKTDGKFDYAITGDGFFAVQNPDTEEIYYTRSGNFQMSMGDNGRFYLSTPTKDLVLSSTGNPIEVTNDDTELDIGIYDFNHKEGMLKKESDLFIAVEKNGAPFLLDNDKLQRGCLEQSNVDLSTQMAKIIEAQRGYQLTLKILQATDEIEQTINNFR